MSQTTIQNQDSLRFGSTQLLVGPNVGSLVDVGALRGMSFVSKVENSELEFDNTPSIVKFAKGDRGSFAFSLAEVNLDTIAVTDGGLVVTTPNPGVATPVVNELHTLSNDEVESFAFKNGANTRVASIVVTNIGGGTTYVEGTDYEIVVLPNGYTGIVRVQTGSITNGQTLEIDYTYTPNTSITMTFNTTGSKTPFYARIINTNSVGLTFRIDITDCANITAMTLPFISDNADDVMVVEMELEGTIVEVVDEQAA